MHVGDGCVRTWYILGPRLNPEMIRSHMSRILIPEWAPQAGVMLTWPHLGNDWSHQLREVEAVFRDIAREVALREGLFICCRDEDHREHVRGQLLSQHVDLERVRLGLAPSNDVWARDHGPITVLVDDRPVMLDFKFNGWGGKYRHDLDDAISRRLHAQGLFGDRPLQAVDRVLEGGGIESDGLGSLLTTTSCLLAPTRNPDLDQAGVEALLKQTLGVRRVLWLHHGHLAGDDTDGHVDTLARFCDEHSIAHVVCTDPEDPHYAPLQAMTQELQQMRTIDGRPYRLIPLPLPAAIHNEEGRRLPATHANFLIINQAVLVPTYADPTDRIALDALASAFPGRQIVGIDCRALIQQFGSLHCVTMQVPA